MSTWDWVRSALYLTCAFVVAAAALRRERGDEVRFWQLTSAVWTVYAGALWVVLT